MIRYFLVFFILITSAYSAISQVYVSVKGKKGNNGGIDAPVPTLADALNICRINGTKSILIREGRYFNTHIILTNKDNGLKISNYKSENVVLYGGQLVKSPIIENGFAVVDIPGSKNRSWDFRMVLVNNQIRLSTRMPQSGEFKATNKWLVKSLPAKDGYWERQPQTKDLRVLRFNKELLNLHNLDLRNAEISILHYWDETYAGIESIDQNQGIINLSYNASRPIGSFSTGRNANNFVIYNVKGGLKQDGAWYLDRGLEKMSYNLMDSEESSKIEMIIPKYRNIIAFDRSGVSNITLSGLKMSAATNKLQNEYFAAKSIDAAISGSNVSDLYLNNIEVFHSGGSGIKLNGNNIKITNSKVHDIGGGGIYIIGINNLIKNCEIKRVGLLFASSVGVFCTGSNNILKQLSIHNTPYSGISGVGNNGRIDSCVITSAMSKMNDGAGIYVSGSKDVKITNNKIIGSGNLIKGIYFDELSSNGIAKNNTVVNASIPFHCHLANNILFEANYFISNKSITFSTPKSESIILKGNTFVSPAIKNYSKNNNLEITSFVDNSIFTTESVSENYILKFIKSAGSNSNKIENIKSLELNKKIAALSKEN